MTKHIYYAITVLLCILAGITVVMIARGAG